MMMKKTTRAIVLFIFCLGFLPLFVSAQNNNGFEQWDMVFTPAYLDELMDIWNIPSPLGGVPQEWQAESGSGVLQTTDAYAGDYALILHHFYHYVPEKIEHRQAIQNLPNYISGYYKYVADANNDGKYPVGLGQVVIVNAQQDTISLTNFELDTIANYTYFEIELNHLVNDVPDSIIIEFRNAGYGYACTGPAVYVCNFLYLDDIQLSVETSTPAITERLTPSINLFPNPSEDYILIDLEEDEFRIELYGMDGRLLLSTQNSRYIDLNDLPASTYFVKIFNKEGFLGVKRFLKQ